jgi:hypothetical protein
LAAQVPTGSGILNAVQTDGSGNSIVYLQTATVTDTLNAIDLASGVQTATNAAGVATFATATGVTPSSVNANGTLKLSTGTVADLSISGGTGNALAALGLNGPTGNSGSFNAARAAGVGGINGKTLTFGSFNGGTAVNVTFGDGTGGTVKTLDQLNTTLQANNLTATLDSTGNLKISANNDYASSTLGSVAAGGALGGTITGALAWSTPSTPVQDVSAQVVRSNLLSQYNNILAQITTTAQDASFNGVNLLGGDTLKLTFNETGKSTLSITGVSTNVIYRPWCTAAAPTCLPRAGAATRLIFTTSPGNTAAGAAFAAQPVVQAEDDLGNLDTSFTGAVTLAIKGGTGTAGAGTGDTAAASASSARLPCKTPSWPTTRSSTGGRPPSRGPTWLRV